MYAYRLQGLLVGSNLPLPGLITSSERSIPDVCFHGGSLPPGLAVEELRKREASYESPLRNLNGEPYSRMWRCARTGAYYFRFIEGFSCVIDSPGRNIWAEWANGVELEVITAFLLGRILAFVLHLRGFLCLHASAVAVDGRAALFAGDPGMGKSSTAGAFVARGFPALSDDVSAIRRDADGRFIVMPGAPRICLLPDSVELLYGRGSAARFSQMLPAEEKRIVPLDNASGKFREYPALLGAIYLLAPRADGPAVPRIENVAGADRLLKLLYNGFMTLALDKDRTASEFPILGEIARKARIRQLVPSSDPSRLGELCDLVLSDLCAMDFSLANSIH